MWPADWVGCSQQPQAQVQLQSQSPPSYTWVSTADEVEMGKRAAAQVEKETRCGTTSAQKRVDEIGKRLLKPPRKDIQYTFKLLDTKTANAIGHSWRDDLRPALYEGYQDDDQLTFTRATKWAIWSNATPSNNWSTRC